MSKRHTLGEILIQKNLVPPEKIELALRIQSGGNSRLGHILIQMGLITDEQLFDALSDQHGISHADLNKGISKEALDKLPRYLCKKHSIIPLSIQENNVLELAMVNPLDQASRTDVEMITGMVVKPALAKENDILNAIRQQMPLKLSDIFYPFLYNKTAWVVCILFLVLSISLGFFIRKEMQLEKYGALSIAGSISTFSNHEMLIGVEGKGAISLIGHGPYAKGFYSMVFNNEKELMEFVDQKENRKNLSEEQYDWIKRIATEKIPPLR